MERKRTLWLAALLVLLFVAYTQLGVRTSVKPTDTLSYITLPLEFSISTYAEGLGGAPVSTPGPNVGPRMMLLKDGVLYVTLTQQGRIVALPDQNKDGKTDNIVTVIDNLNKPHGIDYDNGWFYIAEENRVVRMRESYGLGVDKGTLETLSELPTGGHFTRTLKIHDGNLYVSIGSSCNACYENDERRAAILKCDLDSSACRVYAKGLRNAVGFVFASDGTLYATDNGRDLLGDDIPPDEVNAVEEGKDYGWPTCYGKNVHDGNFDKNVYIRDPCADKQPSTVDLQAHSAPLGLVFYNSTQFPSEYRGKLFVAYHGSWNRNAPTGYKIVTVDPKTLETKDFATGWLQGTNVLGRPVDIVLDTNGSLFVSDDNAGKIYRISYKE